MYKKSREFYSRYYPTANVSFYENLTKLISEVQNSYWIGHKDYCPDSRRQ